MTTQLKGGIFENVATGTANGSARSYGESLSLWLKTTGALQRKLAKALGVSSASIHRWHRANGMLTPEHYSRTLSRTASFFLCSKREFLTWDEDQILSHMGSEAEYFADISTGLPRGRAALPGSRRRRAKSGGAPMLTHLAPGQSLQDVLKMVSSGETPTIVIIMTQTPTLNPPQVPSTETNNG